ncbi:hypothetical protein HHK36_006500 [Tetracentron sinense]|uniref:60S ribosomal protein L2, mitochondrial n=1 Tax=Tetracentron sinense TaxID=13715 RepID=A0A835DKY9_TETSI|nr:hypothetical protein HHK36_006500 [Tetracentron sinense]
MITRETMRQGQEGRALRQFTLSTGKSAGRNSSGRITVFHRGGGSKRLQRRIDLKRSTSSIGIVERIEYDPNRSSRIAPVRWIEGVQLRRQRKCNTIEEFAPPRKILEPTTTTIRDLFSFSSLPGKVDQRKVACFSPGLMAAYVVVGLPQNASLVEEPSQAGIKKTCTKDAARDLGLVGAAEHNESKPKTDQGSLPAKPIGEGPKDGACKVDRAPVVEVKWQGKAIRPFGSSRSIAHIQNLIGERGNAHEAPAEREGLPGRMPMGAGFFEKARADSETWDLGLATNEGKLEELSPPAAYVGHSGECRLQDYDYRGILVGRPTTTRTLYQVMSEAKPPPIGEGTKAGEGQGAKLARAAGTFAKIMKEPAPQCLVRLPSGVEKLIDSRCRATIGIVSNPNHGARKLRKVGQSRWLGRRPIVRGVAMNPVDHPHGGGEGRTK